MPLDTPSAQAEARARHRWTLALTMGLEPTSPKLTTWSSTIEIRKLEPHEGIEPSSSDY